MSCVAQDPDYSRLKDQLIASTGLAFYANRDHELSEVIGQRLSDLRLRNCLSYVELLAKKVEGTAEMDALVDRLTVGETYFFRDPEQFAAIRDVILPDILRGNRESKRLRIWSAGCSTGAEPYSIAILLARELADRIAGWNVEIHATDLNRHYLTQAAEGKFRAWALRSMSDDMKRECFSKEGLTWTLRPRYKPWISFQHMNLAEGKFPTAFAHFDLILCRNVMIYFTPEANHRLVRQFHRSLQPGGWLMVGAAEHNPGNYHDFRSVEAEGTKLYQKMDDPGGSPPGPRAAPPLAVCGIEKPAARPAADQAGQPTMDLLRQLADRGEWQRAAEYGQRLLAENRLNPVAHFYQALIFENLGKLDKSQLAFRQAIYLDRNFALAHYHLGLALKREGHTPAAAKSFGNVLRILDGMPGDATVTAEPGVTVFGLRDLTKMHLGRGGS